MMVAHQHAWNDAGRCRLWLVIAGRPTQCAARRCRIDACEFRAEPPIDYCPAHKRAAFSLTRTK
jgi:hypothetical protein